MVHTYLILICVLLSGCYVSRSGDYLSKTVSTGSEVKYSINDINSVELKNEYRNSKCRFYLEAVGDFTVSTGRRESTVYIGENSISYGFFPGLSRSVSSGSSDWWYAPILLISPFSWIISIQATFVEPFSEEYRKPGELGMMGVAIFGCLKYVDNTRRKSDDTRLLDVVISRVTRIRLKNYSVIDGNGEYFDDNGEIVLARHVTLGEKVRLRISTVPEMLADSKDKLEDLRGMTLECVVR